MREGEHDVGRGDASGRRAVEPHANKFRFRDHVGLAEHDGLDLDAADAPAEHAERIDHRRVRVPADCKIGKGQRGCVRLVKQRDGGDLLQMDLVDDAGTGRKHLQALERALGPLEKLVALAVALELAREVDRFGIRRRVRIDLQRVVHHEGDRHAGIDFFRIAAAARHLRAQRREVHQHGNAGGVGQDNARHMQRQRHSVGPDRRVG